MRADGQAKARFLSYCVRMALTTRLPDTPTTRSHSATWPSPALISGKKGALTPGQFDLDDSSWRFDELRQAACDDHCDVILLFAAAKLTDSADYAV